MRTSVTVTAFSDGVIEAARLIDVNAAPLASVPEPAPPVAPDVFREAVVAAAPAYDGGAATGVLFTPRWGGGGLMLT